jgi:hypothetical protein
MIGESENEIEVTSVNDELYNDCSDYTHDHNYLSSTLKQKEKEQSPISSKRRKKYLIEWEKNLKLSTKLIY